MTKYYTDIGLARCVKCNTLFPGGKYESLCTECDPEKKYYCGIIYKLRKFFNY